MIYGPDGKFHTGTLDIKDGVFSSSLSSLSPETDYTGVSDFSGQDQDKYDKNQDKYKYNDIVINAEGLFVIPGLTDIHFHGCAGFDFCDGDYKAFQAIANYQAKNGVTTICPATMTLPEQKIIEILKSVNNFKKLKNKTGAEIVGINLEGPFLSREKCGAQNPDYIIAPDINIFKKFYDASQGLIKLVSIAPEVRGATSFVKYLKNNFKNLKIALAHTNADYEIAFNSFKNGVNHVTHLYNAMNPINHRKPGPVLAAADFNELKNKISVEIICDGVHVHPAVIKNTFRMFSSDNIIFISDSMRATGMPDGVYELGGQQVFKTGNKVLLNDMTIAGSATNLMDCMRNAVKNIGVPLETAIKCAAVNPARAINIYDKYGSIEPGKIANLVLLNKNLDIITVINNGTQVYY